MNRLLKAWLLTTFIVFFLLIIRIEAQQLDNNKSYNHNECLSCHNKINPALINDWRKSSHAGKQLFQKKMGSQSAQHEGKIIADCVQCHGQIHKNALKKSRRDSACIDCHGGKNSAIVHSYRTSKHGAIMQIRKKQTDWSKPLKLANYRVPGCSYCHMHNAQHNTQKTIRKQKGTRKQKNSYQKISNGANNKFDSEQLMQQTVGVCFNCHSLRYVKRLFENGERMLDIAQKKLSEGQQLVNNAIIQYGKNQQATDQLFNIKQQWKKMQKHYNNVYLGIAHQSPDYQWWHGQPALDGDLLKIKSLVSDLQRRENLKKISP